MALSWLVLVISVQALIVQAKLFEIPEDQKHLVRGLNVKLLKATLDGEANPSVYVGLRLSEEHNLEKENEYLQRLKPEDLCSSTLNIKDTEPKTGLIALHLMAQKASCDNTHRSRLIACLKHHLLKEKESIVLYSKPLTSYYQYSLGILALCVNDKLIDKHFINKIIFAEEKNQFVHGKTISIDTEAMAGLALLCAKNSNKYPREDAINMKKSIKSIKDKILTSQGDEGQLGNIYSTPLAVQFLLALGGQSGREPSSYAMRALLKAVDQGKFSNPMMMSQLMPVFHQKTYLNLANIKCDANTNKPLSIPFYPEIAIGDEPIRVRLVVEGQNFEEVFEVPSQSSLLDVLKAAQKNSDFSFETRGSLYGPYLTTVNSKEGQWLLLKDSDISLLEGIADYKPADGEKIILRLRSA
ncbi:PREDICTED: transcobalamin-2 [Nanorana parkeri]|uniref:transcobalamin-2 n=1 Tax=Nanorana parkeri TaxID=125878 RepID=UPI0008540D1D|nr:PREDICTED: transcobalamin-2 [Nanorana parkeri]